MIWFEVQCPLLAHSGHLFSHRELFTKHLKGRPIYFSRLQFLKFLHALVIVRSARSKAISADKRPRSDRYVSLTGERG